MLNMINTKLCTNPINRSKYKCKGAGTIAGAAIYRSPIITPPANIFPKSLTDIFTGLANSPPMFKGSITGIGSLNLFNYPPKPLVDIFAFKKANVVSSANPTVVFKSAVGDLKAGAN